MRLNALPAYAAILIGALLLARARKPNTSWSKNIGTAVVWFAALEGTKLAHTTGHIISAHLAGAPMDAVIIVYSRQKNLYLNDHVTPAQHVGRALGGPIASGTAAIAGNWLWQRGRTLPMITRFARIWRVFNLAALLISLLPLKPFDGYVLLRWLLVIRRE